MAWQYHVKTAVRLSKLQSPVAHTSMRRILVFPKDRDLSEWITESIWMPCVKIISFLVLLYKSDFSQWEKSDGSDHFMTEVTF